MLRVRISPSKCATEPALEARTSAASPMTKMFGLALACRVCSSTGMKPSASPRPGERLDVRLAAVHRHRHGQVEADLAAVERDEPAAVGVDLAGVELGDHVDAPSRPASR